MEILYFVNRIFENYVFYSSSSTLSTGIIVDLYIPWWGI